MEVRSAGIWGGIMGVDRRGAHFYICGDASKMAKEVDSTLKKIIQKYVGMSGEQSETYVKEMTQTKRYARDVY